LVREAITEAIPVIWKLCVGAELAAAASLLLQGLAGEYPALMTACCVLPIKSLLLISSFLSNVPRDQKRQAAIQLDPVEWIVSAWVVFELFSHWSRSYKGIGRFGKLLMAALLLGALGISFAFWPVEWKALVFAHSFRIYYFLNRIVWVALALFVIGTWRFFRNYPVAIAPNVVRSTYIAAVYFGLNGLSQLIFTMNGHAVVPYINIVIVTASMACYCSWAVLMTRRGQEIPPTQRISPSDAERIERINQELLVFMGEFPKRESSPETARK
jgi:hypothetical protein